MKKQVLFGLTIVGLLTSSCAIAAQANPMKLVATEASKEAFDKQANTKEEVQVLSSNLAEAKFALAKSLRYSQAEEKRELAYALFTSPELSNNPEALYEAGCLYLLHCADWASVVAAYFLPAAELGFKRAMIKMSECYSLGLGVKQDAVAAKSWLEKAKKIQS